MKRAFRLIAALAVLPLLAMCGSDYDEADLLGIGASCSKTEECTQDQQCLTEFKGGYCGVKDCETNDDCPGSSACVVHTNGKNYCFRVCVDKPECNGNRPAETESNCVSSVTYVSGKKEGKVCEPPGS